MRKLSEIVSHQAPLTVPSNATVCEACRRMRDCNTGSILVIDDNGKLVGIFTGRDAVQRVLAMGKSPSRTRIGAVMTPDPVTAMPGQSAVEALHLMWNGGFSHVPVVDGDKILGLVSQTDIVGDEEERHGYEREMWEHLR